MVSMAKGNQGVTIEFTPEEKERIAEQCGMVPVRRMLKAVVLEWLESAESEAEEVDE